MGLPLLLLLAAAVPTLVVSLYMDWLDRRQPEPRSALRRVYLAGVLSVGPVLVAEILLAAMRPPLGPWVQVGWRAFVVAAIPEESAKVACIALMVWRTAAFDEHMDGVTYGVRAGLGFALVENLGYFLTVPDGQLLPVLLVRSVLLVPGHAAWGAIAGYWAARRRFGGDGVGGLGGWLIAVALHGSYDMFIFATQPLAAADSVPGWAVPASTLVALGVLVGSVVWARALARRALVEDRKRDAAIVPGA